MDIHGMYREVSERLLGTLELGKALENSFLYLREHMPLDEMRVNILDRDMKAVRTIATIDPSGPKVMLDHPLVIPLSNVAFDELAGNTFSDIRIVESLDADRATMEVKKTYFSHIPESSLIIMRLILDGQRCAALLVRALGIGRYGERERDILTELNKPFAMAVQNAIAHHEVERLK